MARKIEFRFLAKSFWTLKFRRTCIGNAGKLFGNTGTGHPTGAPQSPPPGAVALDVPVKQTLASHMRLRLPGSHAYDRQPSGGRCSKQTPPWASATPVGRKAAVTGSQNSPVVGPPVGRAVAASRQFAVPGAPPQSLPSPRTQFRARLIDTSPPSPRHRSTVVFQHVTPIYVTKPCSALYTANVLPPTKQSRVVQYFTSKRVELIKNSKVWTISVFDGQIFLPYFDC